MTTFVVTGYMRSGTSMMMRALVLGGMEASHDPTRHWHGEYLYEANHLDWTTPNFMSKHSGKVVKALIGQTLEWCDGEYSIVFMTRDPEDLYNSYWRKFGTLPNIPEADYWERMLQAQQYFLARKDVISLSVFDYAGVLKEPEKAFSILRQEGWPIDTVKAAAVVDPELRRFNCGT